MELKKGGIYIAYKSDNPFKNFKFQVLETDDFFFAAQILEGIGNIELWKPYTIRLTNDLGEQKFLEIAPYYLDDKGKTAKFLVIGNLLERRKFVRFNVESYKIPVEGNQFKGIVENISLGGLKIKLLSKEGEIEEGKPIFVKGKIDGNEYNFVITPVRVGKDFIAAKFEKPAKEISEFFYNFSSHFMQFRIRDMHFRTSFCQKIKRRFFPLRKILIFRTHRLRLTPSFFIFSRNFWII